MSENGGPAFPKHHTYSHFGMSLRDYFAAKAMQGLCQLHGLNYEETTKESYRYADAMLKEREAHEKV